MTLLFFLLLGPAQAGPPPVTTRLEPNLFGQPIVMVQLTRRDGNIQEARMMVDTGAAMTVLDRSLDSTLWDPNLELKDAEVSAKGANGGLVSAEPVLLHQIRFGPIVEERPAAIRLDLSAINRFLDEPIAGVLGMNVLKGHRFWLDFQGRLIRWNQPPDQIYVQQLQMGGLEQAPRIRVEVAGHPIEATFDTGFSGFLSLSAKESPALATTRDPQSGSIQVDVAGAGKQEPIRAITGEVRIGSKRWRKPDVEVARSSGLGVEAMWPGIWLDFQRNEVGFMVGPDDWLDSRPPVRQPLHASWDRSTDPPRLVVLGVKPRSHYESAGLQPNDVILEFGDLKAGTLNLASLRKAVLDGKAQWVVIERKGRKLRIDLPEVSAPTGRIDSQ